jgi:hypothetical protein
LGKNDNKICEVLYKSVHSVQDYKQRELKIRLRTVQIQHFCQKANNAKILGERFSYRLGRRIIELTVMKNIKTILIIIAVVFGAVIAFSILGLVLTLIQYVFWLAVIGIAGVAAYKLFKKSDFPRLEGKTPVNQLEVADRTLEEYKQKYLPK